MLALLGVAAALPACGPSIPGHGGYKSAKSSPWRNPKAIKLVDNEGKVDGELDYPTQHRAKWYAVDLPSSGDLQVSLEANPVNDNEDFDLGMEIYGSGNRVLAKADLEDEDAHELTKNRLVPSLESGRYLVHLFLQGRLDNTDYELKVKFVSKASDVASDFPAQVPYLPPLALVPVIDDTPESSAPKGRTVRRPSSTKRTPTPKPQAEQAPTSKVSAKVLRATMNDRGTVLVLSAGADAGVADGWKGVVSGVKGISFRVSGVTQRTCKALIEGVTAEQVTGHAVTLSPP